MPINFSTIFNRHYSKEKVEEKYAKDIARWVNAANNDVGARSTAKTVTLTKQGMAAFSALQNVSFLDLKDHFRRSSKAKPKKDGGWYLTVPIGNKTRQLRKVSNQSYTSLKSSDFGSSQNFGGSLEQFQRTLQKTPESAIIDPLRYEWKSTSVTRTKKGNRGSYVSFRTVSNTSDPSSWILGKRAFQKDNALLSQKMQQSISEVYQYALAKVKGGEFNGDN